MSHAAVSIRPSVLWEVGRVLEVGWVRQVGFGQERMFSLFKHKSATRFAFDAVFAPDTAPSLIADTSLLPW